MEDQDAAFLNRGVRCAVFVETGGALLFIECALRFSAAGGAMTGKESSDATVERLGKWQPGSVGRPAETASGNELRS
jgi:hypothetical protein